MRGLDASTLPAAVRAQATSPDSEQPDEGARANSSDDSTSNTEANPVGVVGLLPGQVHSSVMVTGSGAEHGSQKAGAPPPAPTVQHVGTTDLAPYRSGPTAVHPEAYDMRHSESTTSWGHRNSWPNSQNTDVSSDAASVSAGIANGFGVPSPTAAAPANSPAAVSGGLAQPASTAITASERSAAPPDTLRQKGQLRSPSTIAPSGSTADYPAQSAIEGRESKTQRKFGVFQSTSSGHSQALLHDSGFSAQESRLPMPNTLPHLAASVVMHDKSRNWAGSPSEIGPRLANATHPADEQRWTEGETPNLSDQSKSELPASTAVGNDGAVEADFAEEAAVTTRSGAGHFVKLEQDHHSTVMNVPTMSRDATQPAALPPNSVEALPDDEDLEIGGLSTPHRLVTGEASGPASTSPASTSPGTVATPARQLAEAIIRSGPESGETELVLSPDELGQVRFSFRNVDGQLNIMISAERPETMALLRRNADLLGAELAQSGMGGAALDFGGGGQAGERNTPTPRAAASGLKQTEVIQPELEQGAGTIRNASSGGRINLRL